MRPGLAIAGLVRAKPRQAVAWAAVLLAFVGGGAVRGDVRVWPYLTVCLVTTAVFAAVDRTVGFSDAALWLLVGLGAAHLAGGLVPDPRGHGVLYDTWLLTGVLRYDQVVHAYGSFTAAYVSWQVLGTWLDLGRTPASTQAWVAALAGLGKGALNEVVEFLLAARLPGQHVGGYRNTGWDLVFDVVGVVAAGVFLVWSRAARRPARRVVAVPVAASLADVAA